MAEKANKKAKRKPAKGDADGVLAALPTTRPSRMGTRHRDSTPAAAVKAKPRPVAKKDKAKAVKAKPKLAATPIAEGAAPRPKPVRSASDNLAAPAKKAAKKRAPAAPPAEKQPSGTELVTTVVQAAGELAQVGLSIGGQVLKRAVDRLPKP